MAYGTLTWADIYGVGSTDTIPSDQQPTQQQANPNNSEVSGAVTKDKASIFHLSGNILGQPIIIWIGMIVLLFAIKFLMESK
jgi:hypothetical protein